VSTTETHIATFDYRAYALVLPDGTRAVNLCGHPIRLVAENGDAWEWAAAEIQAHAPTRQTRWGLGLPTEPESWSVWYDRPELPKPIDGTVYIVPLVTALLASDRTDLRVPHGQRRTDDGRLLVTECTGLARPFPPPEPFPPIPEDQAAGARLIADGDRCEHGRHYGDVCGSGCVGGESLGHPATRDGQPAEIAYSLDGHRWVAYPGRGPVRYVPRGEPLGRTDCASCDGDGVHIFGDGRPYEQCRACAGTGDSP
jgi:hypothetical protein